MEIGGAFVDQKTCFIAASVASDAAHAAASLRTESHSQQNTFCIRIMPKYRLKTG
jgi:hypothetical protein